VINFRYHVVSLTAVFLALAIGLVVGTAALNGPVAEDLHDRVNALGKDNQNLRDQVQHYQEEVNREEDFAQEAAPHLLAGRLAGRRVLVMSMPDGRDPVDGVVDMLTTAGAKITAQVDVQDKFTNPANSVELLELANEAAVPSVPVDGLPTNSDGVETSSALLAAVLMDRVSPVKDSDLRKVVAAYSSANYIDVKDKVSGPAEIVVVITGRPYTDREAADKNKAVVTLADQFDKVGFIVVAGTGVAGDGNAVAAVRGDPALSQTISTLDNVGTSQGRLATALAAAEQISREVGHYGVGSGALALLPKQSQ